MGFTAARQLIDPYPAVFLPGACGRDRTIVRGVGCQHVAKLTPAAYQAIQVSQVGPDQCLKVLIHDSCLGRAALSPSACANSSATIKMRTEFQNVRGHVRFRIDRVDRTSVASAASISIQLLTGPCEDARFRPAAKWFAHRTSLSWAVVLTALRVWRRCDCSGWGRSPSSPSASSDS